MKVIQLELAPSVWQGLYDALAAYDDLPDGVIGEDGHLTTADGRQAIRFLGDNPQAAVDVPIAAIELVRTVIKDV